MYSRLALTPIHPPSRCFSPATTHVPPPVAPVTPPVLSVAAHVPPSAALVPPPAPPVCALSLAPPVAEPTAGEISGQFVLVTGKINFFYFSCPLPSLTLSLRMQMKRIMKHGMLSSYVVQTM